MKEFSYVIQDKDGIHARPAGVLVKIANGFKSQVAISKAEKKGDLKRIFSVMDNTAYYPSTANLSSSLTLANSSSSEFTLRTMAVVSLIIPFVVAYIAYFWRQMDKKSLTTEELNHSEKY